MEAVLKKELNCRNYNKQDVKELRELLTYIYVNNDECFVRILNKSLGITKAYPINSFKEGIKVNSIFNSICNNKEDIFMSLNPFRTMKSGIRSTLFCINAIAVYILNSNRLRDLEKIKEYLNENNINDYRTRLCFLYRNFYSIKQKYQNGELKSDDFENAKNKMLEYNKNLINHLGII